MTDTTTYEESLGEVIAGFDTEMAKGRTRLAAESAYAVAVRADAAGEADVASDYAKKALELLASLPSETIEQVTSTRVSVGGVSIPDLLHDDVVRSRLGHLIKA